MEILIKILQLLLSLSILVLFHEFGHFIAAKAFKVRVEKFYLFFNPWFSLFKIKIKETEYGIGWLPLGGYVKIAGMIDESMDKEQMKQPAQPWEFRTKPAWQRLIIMLGGVTVNVLLAMAIYISLLAIHGEEYLPTSEVKYGVVVDTLGYEMGLRNGDMILSVDQKPVEDFHKITETIILDEAQSIQVMREGQPVEIPIPDGLTSRLLKHQTPFISYRIPFVVGGFADDSPAKEAGILENDIIIGINEIPTPYFDQFKEKIAAFKGVKTQIMLVRNGDTLAMPVQITGQGMIGVAPVTQLDFYFTLHQRDYNFLEAIPAGVVKTFDGIGSYLKQLKLLVRPETKAYESIGSFITIGSIFPSTWDWHLFWRLTAFLSIMLAILNILPIPALDGGHVLFLLFELISGRKPSERFMEIAQLAGMIILLALFALAMGNDIMRLFR
ncbi:MAG: RIP metalloprotease RseP [Bacteroidales bacterium]|nr:RIP metalloprotease RseP [Bacteroidales bacterium]MDD3010979.1 RIP metalloprotease RseP [Bacteroidales bacterium]MDD3961117.1 RIP metalloprotease RseP [Bacteroidales bacterium]MDY0284932.1 RIP metalloprotease RseP [Bacteroidales bacterium]HPE85902.1 RIP metalloprotease RseP [Bacteroidales bacterium]